MVRAVLALACLGGVLVANGAAPPPPSGPPVRGTPRGAAAAALRQVAALGADPRFQGLGLAAHGAAPPEAGEPIPEALVRLDELQRFAPGGDPAALLRDSGAYLVPVRSGGEVVAAVTVARQPGGYAMVAVGDPALAREVVARLPAGGAGASRLVRIPALRLAFVSSGAGRALVLVPVASDARFGVEAGKPEPAAALFERLAPVARAHPTDVPG